MVFQVTQTKEPWEIQQDAYEVLVQGSYTSRELRLHIQGGRKEFSERVRAEIEELWNHAMEDASSRGQNLFNGKLFSLSQYGLRRGHLELLLGETDYRESLGTHLSATTGQQVREDAALSNGIAVCSSIVTQDGFLIVGRRSESVYRGVGKLHVCAGHPDPDSLMTPEQLLGGENLFFAAMKSEMEQELNISAKDLSQMKCLGLIRSRDTWKPEVIFDTAVKLSSDEVRERFDSASDREEHQEILVVRSDKESLLQFLQTHHQDFTAPGLAALIFHGTECGYWTQGVLAEC